MERVRAALADAQADLAADTPPPILPLPRAEACEEARA
jgi:hypothetical protein